MIADLLDVGLWHWMILAVVLVILEILLPGVIFIWMGVAAAATGAIVHLRGDLDWQYQLLLFAALSVASIAAGRVWWARKGQGLTDHPTLNRRGDQQVGRVLTLEEAIVDGVGKVKVGGAVWKVSGPDLPAGTKVVVTAADSTVLRVRKA